MQVDTQPEHDTGARVAQVMKVHLFHSGLGPDCDLGLLRTVLRHLLNLFDRQEHLPLVVDRHQADTGAVVLWNDPGASGNLQPLFRARQRPVHCGRCVAAAHVLDDVVGKLLGLAGFVLRCPRAQALRVVLRCLRAAQGLGVLHVQREDLHHGRVAGMFIVFRARATAAQISASTSFTSLVVAPSVKIR